MNTTELIQKIRSEIERLMDEYKPIVGGVDELTGAHIVLAKLLSFLDSLEPEKPMNRDGLEEEIDRFEDWMETYNQADYPTSLTTRDIARHFYELGCRRTAEKYDEIEYERQMAEESVPNDLGEAAEKEAIEYAKREKPKDADGEIWRVGDVMIENRMSFEDGFIAGAKWQEEKEKEYSPWLAIPKLKEAALEFGEQAKDYEVGGQSFTEDMAVAFTRGAEWQKTQDLAEMAQSKSPLSVAYSNRCFENGKQAMKEQMMKEAVEISYMGGMARINGEERPFEGGKVRVIIVKKEDGQ